MNLTQEEQARPTVRVMNLRHGRPKSNEGAGPLFLYADLINAENGEVLAHATLDYILGRVKNENLVLVP